MHGLPAEHWRLYEKTERDLSKNKRKCCIKLLETLDVVIGKRKNSWIL